MASEDDQTQREAEWRAHDLSREDAKRAHDRHSESITFYRSRSFDFGAIVIRSLMLANGGGAVAMLGFAASVVGSDAANRVDIADSAQAIEYFACGVAATALVGFLAYFNAFFLVEQLSRQRRIWDFPFMQRLPGERLYVWLVNGTLGFAILAALGSLGFFLAGTWTAARSFTG